MDQKLLINHARFKKKPKVGGDTGENKYPDFFNNYAKKNYVLVDNNCLCGKNNDQLIANYDRYSVKFDTVICKNCGLIRALKYFSEENVSDFYKNHYRDIANQLYILPHKIYEKHACSNDWNDARFWLFRWICKDNQPNDLQC